MSPEFENEDDLKSWIAEQHPDDQEFFSELYGITDDDEDGDDA